jgi:MoaA/NifB/PqqE/SkfB family radical SAM enzyme
MSSRPQAEIQLGHLCNNRCVFCVSGQVSEWRQAGQIAADAVIDRLREARASGAARITLLGGEPTIQRSFFDVLRACVELGFEEIVVFTNGVMAHREGFLERVRALGGNVTWRFSVQGGNAQAHDAVTERPGSFAKIMAGLAHLRARGAHVTTNMCVNERSYRSLPDYPALCREHGIAQLHIDQVRPRDAGERSDAELREMMARYSDMAPYLARMLEGFDALLGADYDVNVGNLPYCVLPEWAHKIHHDGELTYTVAVDGADTLSAPWDKYADKRSDKLKPPTCRACVFDASCSGVFEKYAAFHGTGELAPVTLERLRALDRGQRFFCHLVEPYLRGLAGPGAPPPPAPWRLANVHRDTRRRVVALRFARGEGGAEAALELRPPGDAARPAAATDRFALHAAGAVDAALVRWAFAALTAGHADLRVTQPPAASDDALVAVARAASARGELCGLRFLGAKRTADRDGVALYFRADGDPRVVAATVRGDGVRVVNAPDEATATALAGALRRALPA